MLQANQHSVKARNRTVLVSVFALLAVWLRILQSTHATWFLPMLFSSNCQELCLSAEILSSLIFYIYQH